MDLGKPQPMLETLTDFLNQAGAFAPLVYISFFLATALLPFIPTPVVVALGGSMLGSVPAIGYGVIGLGLGAYLALKLSRTLGRPVVIRMVGAKAWEEWEYLLGIRSPALWGLIFFLLNIDFAVVAAGLSSVPMWQLWLSAVIARLPWLVLSAFFGESLLRPEMLPLAVAIIVVLIVAIHFVRKRLRHYLVEKQIAEQNLGKSLPPAQPKLAKKDLSKTDR